MVCIPLHLFRFWGQGLVQDHANSQNHGSKLKIQFFITILKGTNYCNYDFSNVSAWSPEK